MSTGEHDVDNGVVKAWAVRRGAKEEKGSREDEREGDQSRCSMGATESGFLLTLELLTRPQIQ